MPSHLTVQAKPAAVQQVEAFVADFAEHHRIDAGDRNRVTILLEELVTNLYAHGLVEGSGGCTAEIALLLEHDRLSIEFSDDGKPFDPLAQPLPDLDVPAESRLPGKLGLHILRAFVDEASYRRIGDRNVLQMVRRITITAPTQ
jgi:sigma-B regulation protein RsbU (phosphoserine phosphatase)